MTVKRFQDWLRTKYKTCDALNAAWGAHYAAFDKIDPEANQGVEGDGLTGTAVYNDPGNPFHDWSKPVEDWDVFRTELRLDVYRKANALIRQSIPGAELALRCEGGNLPIAGDPKSASMHLRHVYYAQRRNALVHETVLRAECPALLRRLHHPALHRGRVAAGMRETVDAGIVPMFMPLFDHMRDILLNPFTAGSIRRIIIWTSRRKA